MNVTIDRKQFVKTLKVAKRRVNKKRIQTSCIRLTTERQGVQITATDLRVTGIDWIPADVDGSGETAVELARLITVINGCKSDTVTLADVSQDGIKQLKITSGKLTVVIDVTPIEDLPEIPEIDRAGGVMFHIPADVLARMIAQTEYAISCDQTRYILTGARFVIDDNGLSITTTDGRRMSHSVFETEEYHGIEYAVTIPQKMINEIRRVLDGAGDELVQVHGKPEQIAVDLGDTRLISITIDGRFPDWAQVRPSGTIRSVGFSIADMLEAVDAVSVVATRHYNCIRLNVSSQIDVTAETPDVGHAELSIPVNDDVERAGGDFVVSMNPDYLTDLLGTMDKDGVVQMQCQKFDGNPLLFHERGNQGDVVWTEHILMQIRL